MFQSNLKLWMGGVILVLLIAAYAVTVPFQQKRLGNLEGKVDSVGQIQSDLIDLRSQLSVLSVAQGNLTDMHPKLLALQNKVNDLQAQLDKVSTANPIAQTGGAATKQTVNPFNVAVVEYVLDTGGLHPMAEALTETKKIDPTYLGTVNRIRRILMTTQMPASLVEQNKTMIAQLNDLTAALQAGDGEKAAELVTKAHASQHAYSKAIDSWLSSPEANPQ